MPTGEKTKELARKNRLFSKVAEARELLKAEAENILKLHMQIIQEARQKGDFETAAKATQWLIEHLPEDEGVRVIDISVDKPTQVEGPKGPAIQIGIALGGMTQQRQLPEVIEVTPVEDDETNT